MTGSRYVRKLFSKKELMPEQPQPCCDLLEIEKRAQNLELLEECRRLYDALAPFRRKRKRAKDFAFGEQWNDVIIDPDDPCGEKRITEAEYYRRQGQQPLSNNLIRKVVKSALGMVRGNKRESIAVSRDHNEANLGDMLSVALQYAYQINEANELDARNFEEALCSGMAIASVRYRYNKERQSFDVWMGNENPARVFFNGDVQDIRMGDLRIIGFVRDYTMNDLLADFANNIEEAERLKTLYNRPMNTNIEGNPALDARYGAEAIDFYVTNDIGKVRVIEVWRLESKQRLRLHDTLKGETQVTEVEDKERIDAENQRRAEEHIKAGGNADEAPLINYEWFVDEYWVGHYLSPWGDELLTVETPFEHKSHPYVLRIYPLFDGEPHSFVEDIIPQQKYINRYITMMDFIRRASAKGALFYPINLVPEGVSRNEIASAWTRPNSVFFVDMKPGEAMPQQISATANTAGDVEMLNIQMQLLEDISGVHSAMMGKTASSSTPAALYAQEAQNASNNLLDMVNWFYSFVKARDYKVLKVIQQFYNEPRYINIAGREYTEEAKWYNPERVRNSEFDIAIGDSIATPAYRMVLDNTLTQLLQQGLIDLKTFLENSSLPFAQRMLQDIIAREQTQQQPITPEMMQQVQDATPEEANAAIQQGASAPQEVQQEPAPEQMQQEEGEEPMIPDDML